MVANFRNLVIFFGNALKAILQIQGEMKKKKNFQKIEITNLKKKKK